MAVINCTFYDSSSRVAALEGGKVSPGTLVDATRQ